MKMYSVSSVSIFVIMYLRLYSGSLWTLNYVFLDFKACFLYNKS
uniref:Uncharacterized protein n=1 Tax=Anguilla anguilla TaxID=7936 RepID=A0A0E9W9L6_ANGAN